MTPSRKLVGDGAKFLAPSSPLSRQLVCLSAAAAGIAVLAVLRLRWRRLLRGARAGRPIRLRSGAEALPLGPLVPKARWAELPGWIQLKEERGRWLGEHPSLSCDPLFQDNGEPKLLPFRAPVSLGKGKGAAVVCPGGNYEFLAPYEAEPIARWLAEGLGIPAFVLKYRLLPDFGLQEKQEDFASAVRAARLASGGGPVVTVGFSAGGHLVACGCAVSQLGSESRPDAQVLVYPCIDPSDWLDERSAGFWNVKADTPQVRSLAEGRSALLAGPDFVAPPPSFVVACTEDACCPPSTHVWPYVEAARGCGASVECMVGKFGGHGFGLRSFWAEPCLKWLQGLGFGRP